MLYLIQHPGKLTRVNILLNDSFQYSFYSEKQFASIFDFILKAIDVANVKIDSIKIDLETFITRNAMVNKLKWVYEYSTIVKSNFGNILFNRSNVGEMSKLYLKLLETAIVYRNNRDLIYSAMSDLLLLSTSFTLIGKHLPNHPWFDYIKFNFRIFNKIWSHLQLQRNYHERKSCKNLCDFITNQCSKWTHRTISSKCVSPIFSNQRERTWFTT